MPQTNGTWRVWVLGIVAGLVLVGVAAQISTNIDYAARLSASERDIKNLQDNLVFRTRERFTRPEAERLEDRLNARIEELRHRSPFDQGQPR